MAAFCSKHRQSQIALPPRALLAAVLLLAAAPLPGSCGKVGLEPGAVVEAVALHLGRLGLLRELPPGPNLLIETRHPDDPKSLCAQSAKGLQALYIQGLHNGDAQRQAAYMLLAGAALDHEQAGLAASLLHQAGASEELGARLKRWARQFPGDETDDRQENMALLRGIFDGAEIFDESADAAIEQPLKPEEPRKPEEFGAGLLATLHPPVRPSQENLRRWLDHPADSVGWVFRGINRQMLEWGLAELQLPRPFDTLARAVFAGGVNAERAEQKLQSSCLQWTQRFFEWRYEPYEGMYEEAYPGLPDLLAAYAAHDAAPSQLAVLLQHTVFDGGLFSIEHSPNTWARLSPSQRSALADNAISVSDPFFRGVDLTLRFAAADVAALAERYAGSRPPEIIEAVLREALGDLKSVELPFAALLPRFVREHLWRYENITGPNCFRAALSFREAERFRSLHVDEERLIAELQQGYDVLASGPLRLGDLLVWSQQGEPTHSAVYLDGGYVFTKNGVSRHNPYLIQHHTDVSHEYSDSDIRVFRPRPR